MAGGRLCEEMIGYALRGSIGFGDEHYGGLE